MGPKLLLVGGFLGSGKTTLLWEAARRLAQKGRVVGLVTNDQAPNLVDTAFLSRSGAGVREVSGSCFCCNFDGFTGAVASLVEENADTIIAEPVGSCTDLSATIMQPLKDRHPEVDLAPMTVLVDPVRIQEALHKTASRMHASALYILRLQMQEADRILLNKTDTLSSDERTSMVAMLRETFPGTDIGAISARTGEGIDAWLAAVLADGSAGGRIVPVDYDRYAEGEAVLGWLNAVADLQSHREEPDWGLFCLDFLEGMHAVFLGRGAEIGHLKLALDCNGKGGTANLTRLGGEIQCRGLEWLVGEGACLILNARVQISAAELESIVRETLASCEAKGVSVRIRTLRCLTPGRPTPTHRYPETAIPGPAEG